MVMRGYWIARETTMVMGACWSAMQTVAGEQCRQAMVMDGCWPARETAMVMGGCWSRHQHKNRFTSACKVCGYDAPLRPHRIASNMCE